MFLPNTPKLDGQYVTRGPQRANSANLARRFWTMLDGVDRLEYTTNSARTARGPLINPQVYRAQSFPNRMVPPIDMGANTTRSTTSRQTAGRNNISANPGS